MLTTNSTTYHFFETQLTPFFVSMGRCFLTQRLAIELSLLNLKTEEQQLQHADQDTADITQKIDAHLEELEAFEKYGISKQTDFLISKLSANYSAETNSDLKDFFWGYYQKEPLFNEFSEEEKQKLIQRLLEEGICTFNRLKGRLQHSSNINQTIEEEQIEIADAISKHHQDGPQQMALLAHGAWKNLNKLTALLQANTAPHSAFTPYAAYTKLLFEQFNLVILTAPATEHQVDKPLNTCFLSYDKANGTYQLQQNTWPKLTEIPTDKVTVDKMKLDDWLKKISIKSFFSKNSLLSLSTKSQNKIKTALANHFNKQQRASAEPLDTTLNALLTEQQRIISLYTALAGQGIFDLQNTETEIFMHQLTSLQMLITTQLGMPTLQPTIDSIDKLLKHSGELKQQNSFHHRSLSCLAERLKDRPNHYKLPSHFQDLLNSLFESKTAKTPEQLELTCIKIGLLLPIEENKSLKTSLLLSTLMKVGTLCTPHPDDSDTNAFFYPLFEGLLTTIKPFLYNEQLARYCDYLIAVCQGLCAQSIEEAQSFEEEARNHYAFFIEGIEESTENHHALQFTFPRELDLLRRFPKVCLSTDDTTISIFSRQLLEQAQQHLHLHNMQRNCATLANVSSRIFSQLTDRMFLNHELGRREFKALVVAANSLSNAMDVELAKTPIFFMATELERFFRTLQQYDNKLQLTGDTNSISEETQKTCKKFAEALQALSPINSEKHSTKLHDRLQPVGRFFPPIKNTTDQRFTPESTCCGCSEKVVMAPAIMIGA